MCPDHLLYSFERSVRSFCLLLLIVVLVLWCIFVGYDLVRSHLITVYGIVGSIVAGISIVSLIWYAVRGGTWAFHVSDNAVGWDSPDYGKRDIAFSQIDHFYVSRNMGGGGAAFDAPPPTNVVWFVLTSGEKVRAPPSCIGDEVKVRTLLSAKLRFEGVRDR